MCTNNNVKPFHHTCLWVYNVQKHLGVCYMPPNIVLLKLRYTGFPERIKLGYVGHGTSPTTQKIWCEHESAENQVQQQKCELKPDFKCKKPGRLSNTILSLTRNVWKQKPNKHDEEAWAFSSWQTASRFEQYPYNVCLHFSQKWDPSLVTQKPDQATDRLDSPSNTANNMYYGFLMQDQAWAVRCISEDTTQSFQNFRAGPPWTATAKMVDDGTMYGHWFCTFEHFYCLNCSATWYCLHCERLTECLRGETYTIQTVACCSAHILQVSNSYWSLKNSLRALPAKNVFRLGGTIESWSAGAHKQVMITI